ncbi:MAG: hypothetical protein IT285_12435 [Bdellovibrionales bacterium]|nr:hypothetical protein [Bdellovibrionales bacterium]
MSAPTGEGSFAVPVPLSPTRAGGLAPSLSVSYDSGAGNSVFGLGWTIGVPSVKRPPERASWRSARSGAARGTCEQAPQAGEVRQQHSVRRSKWRVASVLVSKTLRGRSAVHSRNP